MLHSSCRHVLCQHKHVTVFPDIMSGLTSGRASLHFSGTSQYFYWRYTPRKFSWKYDLLCILVIPFIIIGSCWSKIIQNAHAWGVINARSSYRVDLVLSSPWSHSVSPNRFLWPLNSREESVEPSWTTVSFRICRIYQGNIVRLVFKPIFKLICLLYAHIGKVLADDPASTLPTYLSNFPAVLMHHSAN